MGGHFDIIEKQFGCIAGMLADFFKVLAALKALNLLGLNHHDRDTLGPLVRIGLGTNKDQIGGLPIGDKRLRAIDDIAIAVFPGRRFDVLQIRARSRLGHRDGAHQFAFGKARQPALLLLF